VDAARDLIRRYGLDPRPPVLIGHSAGGHLALWAAARARLPTASPLRAKDPLPIKGVVDLAGLTDLEHDLKTACGADPVLAMRGSAPGLSPYADTSPIVLAPLGLPQVVLHGAEDVTVRPEIGVAYAERAVSRGDPVIVLTPPGGHVEEIAPETPAWAAAAAAVLRLVSP